MDVGSEVEVVMVVVVVVVWVAAVGVLLWVLCGLCHTHSVCDRV